MKKVSTTQELKSFWNNFQKDYTSVMEPNLLSLFILLFNSSRILAPNNNLKYQRLIILEEGCGGGAGLEYIITQLNSRDIEADIYGTDISNYMLDHAYDRLKNYNSINLEFLDSEKHLKINNNTKINLFLKEADNEKLPFEDNKFDLIIASLSLHLVSDPDSMIKESKRVLKNGASAHFSIWGKPENCLPFTIIPNNIKKAGVVLPEDKRSNFHLSNPVVLRDLFSRNEIQKYKIQTSFIPFNFLKGEDYLIMLNGPSFIEMMKNLSEEEKENVRKNIAGEINEKINSEEYFGIEAYLLKYDKI
jgi:ubiquinone/menaquinone biosynthesis C-methylase UbiE